MYRNNLLRFNRVPAKIFYLVEVTFQLLLSSPLSSVAAAVYCAI